MKTANLVKIAVPLAGALLVLGCIPSLHPFYHDEDVVFDANLVGRWEDESGEAWEFSDAGDDAYELVYTDDEGKTGKFAVHLFKIEDRMFLDVFPAEPETEWNDLYALHLMPVHTLMHVRQIRPTLQMAMPEARWLELLLEDQPKAIAHEIIDDDVVVLTASTDELQKFWGRHAKSEDAFGDYSDLTPVEAAPAD